MAKGTSSYTEYNNILTQLNEGTLSSVYLLQGEETHFLDAILTKIEEKVLDESTKSFNHHVFYGKETNVPELINISRRFPMMAEKQLVVYKEAQYCRNADDIIQYLESPVESTVLVWFHPGKKIPSNRKLYKEFAKAGIVFTADPIAERDLDSVIGDYIKTEGYDMEPKPLHLLINNSGGKFSVIVSELEKVFSNLEKGSKIREEHIQKYVGINKEYNVFALQKALAYRNKTKVIEIVNYFVANMKNNPLVLINGTLFSYFKKIAIMQSMMRNTDKEIMSAVGIPYFVISEYRQAATNYPGKKLVQVLDYINECDLKSKGIKENSGTSEELFEETMLKILSL